LSLCLAGQNSWAQCTADSCGTSKAESGQKQVFECWFSLGSFHLPKDALKGAGDDPDDSPAFSCPLLPGCRGAQYFVLAPRCALLPPLPWTVVFKVGATAAQEQAAEEGVLTEPSYGTTSCPSAKCCCPEGTKCVPGCGQDACTCVAEPVEDPR